LKNLLGRNFLKATTYLTKLRDVLYFTVRNAWRFLILQ